MKQSYLTTPSTLVFPYVILMFMTTGLLAQVVNHPLEGNLNDTANNVSGTFLEWKNTFPTPNYVATPSGGQGIDLAHDQYVLLDNSFQSLIVSDDSFEIEIDFRYTYAGTGNGRKPIYGSKPPGNASAGLVLNALNNNATTFNIFIGFADDNFDESSFFKVNPFPLNKNEEINISLKIDYQSRSWFFKANDVYNFGFFSEGFDMDIFRNTLQNLPAYIGWQKDHGWDMEFHNFDGTMIIDQFKLHVPARPGDISALQTALQQMTDHILGNISLTQEEKDTHTNTIIVNYQKNYTNAKTEIDNYLAAFEANYDALFTNRAATPSLSSLLNEQRIAYFLMQDIFDNEFVAGNIANVAGMSFREGSIYPGPVSNAAPRVTNAQVAIQATYLKDPGIQLVHGHHGVLRPTGYYAAPGELVTVTVPAAMVNQGIKIVAGAHINETSLAGMQRFQRISKAIEITSTTTQIANPFGGAIYFRIPQETTAGWQTVTINGAVKAPYFRMVTGQPQNVSQWITDLTNAYVPWADIESDKMMFTLPTSMVGVTDVTDVMLKWGEMMDLVNTVAGRPLHPVRAEYVQVDCSGGVGSAGYPKRMHENTFDKALPSTYWNPLRVLESDFVETNRGFIFHELGHNMLFPIPRGHAETVVQMFSVPSYFVLSNDLEKSISYAEDETYGRDTGAIAWMITPEFRNNSAMLDEHAKYQVRGGVKWFDIVDMFSWEDLGKLNKFFYDKWTAEGGSPLGDTHVTDSEYLQAATERIGFNMTPLLNFWGMIPTANEINTYASYQASCKIYDRLLHYKSLVPKTQAEFLPWRDLLLSEVDPYHHAEINDIYNNYNVQNIGNQILTQIDNIIATYYPNGECNPLQLTFTVDASDTTITIPTDTNTYTYNYRIDWNGDGDYQDSNETTPFTGNATHDFGAAGTYTINLEGRFPTIYFNNGGDKNKITSIDNWGGMQWASLRNSFYGCSNLTISDQAGAPGLTNVTSMLRAFRATGVNTTGNLNDWDVSNVRDFRAMLRDATAFDQELSNWNISSATAMNNMFSGVAISTLNYDKTLIGWATLSTGETQIPTGINFHGGNSSYCTSEPQRNQLMATAGNGGFSWTITDSNIKACGIKVSPIAFLQGTSINPNTGEENLMRDDLRIAGLLPTTSPYTDGLNCNTSVFNAVGNDAIVDWIWLELRDANDVNTIINGRSALLQRDGDIVEIDGTSPVTFQISQTQGDYYLMIQHRNHLAIRTQAPESLTSNPIIMDLSIDPLKVAGGVNALQLMSNGKYAVIAGDYDGNGQVQNADVNQIVQLLGGSGYHKADTDLNGQIQNTDINNSLNPNLGKGVQF
ncbi:M60 family peptidase N-terminal accessory domain-containing protein [Aquimarina sp. 2201CG5-10]|uniref:M60 family peptidase N-terminal accessory domain-containing protein n=1 Tax=Aquimarina callyspongiae TaxID=3098150 RepID=UPI002AB36E50|nr:M60 family peptidase N-terminal accessory domain-containing protein [Aquimarina sp. 2201CG5-10]MDY8134883.1 M60 family peptidase N-terminal accessory domain-containing protein [Aquimarina sp. 2201CG5-10]